LRRGHDSWSCDLLPTERAEKHFQCDVREVLMLGLAWDLLIGHPPCTNLAVSGAPLVQEKEQEQSAISICGLLLKCAGWTHRGRESGFIISSAVRKPDQVIQLDVRPRGNQSDLSRLKNLPVLTPSNVVGGVAPQRSFGATRPERWLNRSRTFTGIAQAMAEQWGAGQIPAPQK